MQIKQYTRGCHVQIVFKRCQCFISLLKLSLKLTDCKKTLPTAMDKDYENTVYNSYLPIHLGPINPGLHAGQVPSMLSQ